MRIRQISSAIKIIERMSWIFLFIICPNIYFEKSLVHSLRRGRRIQCDKYIENITIKEFKESLNLLFSSNLKHKVNERKGNNNFWIGVSRILWLKSIPV